MTRASARVRAARRTPAAAAPHQRDAAEQRGQDPPAAVVPAGCRAGGTPRRATAPAGRSPGPRGPASPPRRSSRGRSRRGRRRPAAHARPTKWRVAANGSLPPPSRAWRIHSSAPGQGEGCGELRWGHPGSVPERGCVARRSRLVGPLVEALPPGAAVAHPQGAAQGRAPVRDRAPQQQDRVADRAGRRRPPRAPPARSGRSRRGRPRGSTADPSDRPRASRGAAARPRRRGPRARRR